MIVTELQHADTVLALPLILRRAVEFLRTPDIARHPDSRVEIDGIRSFAIIQRYETTVARPPQFEYHRKYIDVQFIASGEEIIAWAPLERVETVADYDPDRDAGFGTISDGKWTSLYLSAGQLAIFLPEDAHAPKLAVNAPSPVTKIVVKVAI